MADVLLLYKTVKLHISQSKKSETLEFAVEQLFLHSLILLQEFFWKQNVVLKAVS